MRHRDGVSVLPPNVPADCGDLQCKLIRDTPLHMEPLRPFRLTHGPYKVARDEYYLCIEMLIFVIYLRRLVL